MLLVVVGSGQHHCYHQASTVKPEAATAVVVAPDYGHDDARNMLSCFRFMVPYIVVIT